MSDRFRLMIVTLLMFVVSLTVIILAIVTLYNASINEQKKRLTMAVNSQARLLEGIAVYHAEHEVDKNDPDVAAKIEEITLRHIQDFQKDFEGFGITGEFTLAKLENGYIKFLISHRHFDMNRPKDVPLDSETTIPMQKALKGFSGTIIAKDYRGETVLAAYEPVANLNWGLVAKIDLTEVRAPFIKTAIYITLAAIITMLIGSRLTKAVGNPIISHLEESEARHRAILETAADGIITIDVKGEIQSFNKAAEKIFGYSAQEIIGKPVTELMPEPFNVQHQKFVKRYNQTGQSRFLGEPKEFPALRKDGTLFPMNLSVSEVLVNDIKLYTGIVRDITENKLAKEALARESERLAVTLRSIVDGVIVTDVFGGIIILNDLAQKYLGISEAEALGKQLLPFIPDEQARLKWVEQLEKKSEIVYVEFRTPEPDSRTLTATQNMIIIDGKEQVGSVTILHDVTREREIDRMKSDFVSSVSHELRTPLTSIKGFAVTLARNPNIAPETQARFLNIINEESNRLLALIEEILEISLIESGKIRMTQENVYIHKVLDSVVSALAPMANERNIELKADIDANLFIPYADSDKIHAILHNLVSNGIKFTGDGGKIEITAFEKGSEIIIQVSDNGMGVAKGDQEKIFDRFYRAHRPGKEIAGTGLGLAFVKELMALHGGRIEVKSEIEKGACFTLYFPMTTAR